MTLFHQIRLRGATAFREEDNWIEGDKHDRDSSDFRDISIEFN